MQPEAKPTNQERTLESWKEIASYLQRDAKTARRWELEEGLPIHRHSHSARASVYAYPSELDAWRESRKVAAGPAPPAPWWRGVFARRHSVAMGVTMMMALVMVGSGVHPQPVSAQQDVAQKRVWAPAAYDLVVSRDGGTYAHTDGEGNFVVRDANAANERKISSGQALALDSPVLSADGQMVAGSTGCKVTIAETSGNPNPRVLDVCAEASTVEYVYLMDWSPDGRQIAAHLEYKDDTTWLGVVPVAGGPPKALKKLGWDMPGQVLFSPDGKFLAYDLARGQDLERRDLWVISVEGTGEWVVGESGYNELAGWSPDGQRLVYVRERNGKHDLWAAPVQPGQPPQRLFVDAGALVPKGMNLSGNLFYAISVSRRADSQLMPVDLANGRLFPDLATAVLGTFIGFSPDGGEAAFLATDGHSPRIVVHNLETHELRYLPRTFVYTFGASWSPDGRWFAVTGATPGNSHGLHRVDAQTGAAFPVAVYTGERRDARGTPWWSPDSKKIYYQGVDQSNWSIREHHLVTGIDRELTSSSKQPSPLVPSPDGKRLYIRQPSGNGQALSAIDLSTGAVTPLLRRELAGGVHLSPDGRYIVTRVRDEAGSAVVLIATVTGEVRELMRARLPEEARVVAWDRDSSGVLVWHGKSEQAELWRVPLNGPAVRQSGTYRATLPLNVSPDGSFAAYGEEQPARQSELWLLENLLR